MNKRTPKTKRPKATNTDPFYVTNAELLQGYADSVANGGPTKTFTKYLVKVANKYANHHWFRGYSYKEDLIAEALVVLAQNWRKFDPQKPNPNPFSYYTQCCHYSFLRVMHQERQQSKIRDELLIDAGMTPSFGFSGTTSDDVV